MDADDLLRGFTQTSARRPPAPIAAPRAADGGDGLFRGLLASEDGAAGMLLPQAERERRERELQAARAPPPPQSLGELREERRRQNPNHYDIDLGTLAAVAPSPAPTPAAAAPAPEEDFADFGAFVSAPVAASVVAPPPPPPAQHATAGRSFNPDADPTATRLKLQMMVSAAFDDPANTTAAPPRRGSSSSRGAAGHSPQLPLGLTPLSPPQLSASGRGDDDDDDDGDAMMSPSRGHAASASLLPASVGGVTTATAATTTPDQPARVRSFLRRSGSGMGSGTRLDIASPEASTASTASHPGGAASPPCARTDRNRTSVSSSSHQDLPVAAHLPATPSRYRVIKPDVLYRKTPRLGDIVFQTFRCTVGDVVTGTVVPAPPEKKKDRYAPTEWLELAGGGYIPCADENGHATIEPAVGLDEERRRLALAERVLALANASGDGEGDAALPDEDVFLALTHGRVELAEVLLAAGCTAEGTDRISRRTALDLIEGHRAFDSHPRANAVVRLLAGQVPLTEVDADGRTPLHRAAAAGRADFALSLVMSNGFLDIPDANGKHCLHHALAADVGPADPRAAAWRTLTQQLATRRALAALGGDGETALHAAIYAGKPAEQVDLLLDYGARPDLFNAHGRTPLLAALTTPAFWGQSLGVERVVRRLAGVGGAKILDARDRATGRTALRAAVATGRVELVLALLAAGASPYEGVEEGAGGPLHDAALAVRDAGESWRGAVQALCGAPPRLVDTLNIKNADGATPLHVACAAGNLHAVRLLCAEQPILSESNRQGETPLHVAAGCAAFDSDTQGAAALLKGLCANRLGAVSLSHADDRGRTPLHAAAAAGRMRAVAHLLAMGAPRGVPDGQGRLAWQLLPAGHPEAVVVKLRP